MYSQIGEENQDMCQSMRVCVNYLIEIEMSCPDYLYTLQGSQSTIIVCSAVPSTNLCTVLVTQNPGLFR